MRAPIAWWWPRPQGPPEVVADAEVPIGPDGKVEIEIDTAFAKAAHPNRDHRYEIQATELTSYDGGYLAAWRDLLGDGGGASVTVSSGDTGIQMLGLPGPVYLGGSRFHAVQVTA